MDRAIFPKLFISVFLFTFLSCENDIEITPLNPVKFPEASESFIIEEGLYENVFLLDSFIIMNGKRRTNDKLIHVYNKNNLQLITKFGTNGLAPFELPGGWPLDNASITQKSDNILFYDTRTWHFKTINLDKIVKEGDIANSISSKPMDRDLLMSAKINQLNDNEFAVVNYFDKEIKGLFFIYDTIKKEKKWIPHVLKMNVEDNYKRELYFGQFHANNTKNTIIYASRYFDQVLFFDSHGNFKKQYAFSKLKIPDFSKNSHLPSIETSILYAVSSYASSEFCFVLRHGRVGKNIISPPPPLLLVFNWDGLLMKTFELTESVIPPPNVIFCYDEEFGYLYSFESSKEENDPYVIVRKYHIGEFLKVN